MQAGLIKLSIWDGTRKPIRESFTYQKVMLNGKEEEIAYFETAPFEDISEYVRYQMIAKDFPKLVTRQEWDDFYKLLGN